MKYALLLLVFSAVAIFGQRIPKQAETFIVSTGPKTPAHPYYQQGFGVGYKIDNLENPKLTLFVGRNYTFSYNGSCIHPFYISSDPSGQGAGVVTEGVVKQGNQVCRDTPNLVFSPTKKQSGMVFYYQCLTHSKMGWQINIADEPFCDKYSRLLGITNEALVSAVVGDVFVNLTKPNADLKEYFDGTTPTGSTDFTDPKNANATAKLANGLVAFFGIALGCPDPAFPKYTGNTDMKSVHRNIPIGQTEFDTFNKLVLDVMGEKGVKDQADLAGVLAVLNTLQPDICNDVSSCKNSFCDRYSRALKVSNRDLMKTVVVQTFTKAVDPASPIKGFFDGNVPRGSVNFTSDSNQQGRLVYNLMAFFGGILQCTDPGFPAYNASTDLADVHKAMPIGTNEFNTFNGALLQVLKDAGVSDKDRAFVGGYLESTKPDICNQPDCKGNVQPGIKFVLDVVPKVNHPVKDGFQFGFQVDGLEGRPLNLIVGKVYSFQNNGGCMHPLYITTSPSGQGAGEVSEGVVYPGGDPFKSCNGGILTFTPTQAQITQSLYYQCRNHDKMGYTIKVFAQQSDIPVTTGSGTITLESSMQTGTTAVVGTTGDVESESDASALLPSLMALFALLALLF